MEGTSKLIGDFTKFVKSILMKASTSAKERLFRVMNYGNESGWL